MSPIVAGLVLSWALTGLVAGLAYKLFLQKGRLLLRLEDAGFVVSRADRPDTEGLGMIYAVRSHPTSAGAGGP